MPPRIAQITCACLLMVGSDSAARAQLSDKIRAEIVAPLPKFEPPAPGRPPASPVGNPAPLSDDPLVRLPDYQVWEAPDSNHDPDLWLSRRALEQKAMGEYSDSMTDLEWALNSWYIPFVTPSPQARANAAYAAKKIRSEHGRLTSLTRILASIDPAEARRLMHDLDFSSHPNR